MDADIHADNHAGDKGGLTDKLLHSDSLVYTYLRSIVSSQCAGWTDMAVGFILFAWAGFSPLWATALGAVCGGILNCVINYRFTFRADGCDWRAVIVKYVLVWIGSMLLNSYGTDMLYRLMNMWPWLETIGFRPDGYYAVARVVTSLLVGWFWNFVLQRYFVYRRTRVDAHIVKMLAAVGIGKTEKKK